jgi:soluble lytic murein transglycosylase
MMIFRSILIAGCLLLPMRLMAQDDMHVQSAFLFAKHKQWNEALLHAKATHNPVLVKYFTWQFLRDPQSGADFDTITSFIEQNPDWPDQAGLERRAEVVLLSNNPSDKALDEWFAKHPPQTSIAKLKTAKNEDALKSLIREAWVNDDYDKTTEEKLLDKYHGILREDDHNRRIDRLIWEGKNEEAKRLVKKVSPEYQHLFTARIALAEDKTLAPLEVMRVPANLRTDPGLIYERIRWRMRDGDKDGVRQLLLAAPKEVPYPEKWWPLRDRQIREAIAENNLPMAQKLLSNHGQTEGSLPYKEMQWLTGWMNLEFLNEPVKANRIFAGMFDNAKTPSGRARIAYWAGRSAEKSNNKPYAQQWYANAAYYPTTFYGQLAMWEMDKNAMLRISSSAEPSASDKEHFKKRELVQLVYVLGQAGEPDEAGRFIFYLTENAKTPGEAILATRLGREIRRIDYGVRASKKALQNTNTLSLESGWPSISVPTTSGLEKSFLLGLMRQESEFNADVVSPSGAVGLMQLLPGTAKETAKKAHLPYSSSQLFDSNYNMTVGSLYLSKVVDQFDGSYVLATASYNAGPGRVRQWEEQTGTPTKDVHAMVDWVEKIPVSETRNYVQHVLENTEVYRYVTAERTPVKLRIAEDLTR